MDSIIRAIKCIIIVGVAFSAGGQEVLFTESDSLRGSLSPARTWWDVHYYELQVEVDPSERYIDGEVEIHFTVVDTGQRMQIDLRQPLKVDSVLFQGQSLTIDRREHLLYLNLPIQLNVGSHSAVSVHYSGQPRSAPNPPWDGGFVWSNDGAGNPWIATACQGLGASVWWPNKDHLSDEPDSVRITAIVPKPLVNVSNGTLENIRTVKGDRRAYTWFVSNPINNYNLALNIGTYTVIRDTFKGKNGALPLAYWVLEEHSQRARDHFIGAIKPMLRCFEHWFGAYPYYEDGYKLVETPFLGMEHQSAIAYGNFFNDGYLGVDVSGTGWGDDWDYIIVHESGHEWWGNHVSVRDIADLWVHEGFTSYSEGIYVECTEGTDAAGEYIRGLRRRISNDQAIIGPYGVNMEGSQDMYYKGANILHMIRQLAQSDSLWHQILVGLQDRFGDETTTSDSVEHYMDDRISVDLKPVFDQYLRHSSLPVLQYRYDDGQLQLRWNASAENFSMPVDLRLSSGAYRRVSINEEWMSIPWKDRASVAFHPNYYILSERVRE